MPGVALAIDGSCHGLLGGISIPLR